MQSPQEQIATVADFLKRAGDRIARRSLLQRDSKQRHGTRRYGVAKFIDDLIALLRRTRMPRILPMGVDCLRVEFDLRAGGPGLGAGNPCRTSGNMPRRACNIHPQLLSRPEKRKL
jgi:hypothetical protein